MFYVENKKSYPKSIPSPKNNRISDGLKLKICVKNEEQLR